jgi:hypothetical protein
MNGTDWSEATVSCDWLGMAGFLCRPPESSLSASGPVSTGEATEFSTAAGDPSNAIDIANRFCAAVIVQRSGHNFRIMNMLLGAIAPACHRRVRSLAVQGPATRWRYIVKRQGVLAEGLR